jgi:hypothetical protein
MKLSVLAVSGSTTRRTHWVERFFERHDTCLLLSGKEALLAKLLCQFRCHLPCITRISYNAPYNLQEHQLPVLEVLFVQTTGAEYVLMKKKSQDMRRAPPTSRTSLMGPVL